MNPKPKILVVGQGVRPTGFARVLESIVSRLTHRYEIHYFAINYRGAELKQPWVVYPNCLEGDVLGVGQLPHLLDKIQPVLVFMAHDFWLYTLHKPALDKRPEIRTILYCPVDGRLTYPKAFVALHSLNYLVSYTHFGEIELRKALATSQAEGNQPRELPIRVIPHGVDTSRFYPLGINTNNGMSFSQAVSFDPMHLRERRVRAREQLFPERPELQEAFIVLNGNRNNFRKRLNITIEAFARFARGKPSTVMLYLHENLHQIDAATAQTLRVLEREGRLLRLNPNESSSLNVSDEQLNLIYNCCDLGLNTSSGEGWGLVSWEHAATGAAQIVPNHSSCSELWRNIGILLEPVTSEYPPVDYIEHRPVSASSVATALEALYSNRDLLAKRSQLAFEHVTQPTYQWDVIAHQWERLFSDVIETNSMQREEQIYFTASHNSILGIDN